MMALQSSVTRTAMKDAPWGASQRVSIEQAIRVAMLHGAYASFEENRQDLIACERFSLRGQIVQQGAVFAAQHAERTQAERQGRRAEERDR
jgi:hypothetical protein